MAFNYLEGDLSEALTQEYLNSHSIAIDTETTGLNLHRDRLCLVQMANEKGVTTLVKINGKNTPNLKKVLESTSSIKIFHFARFDLGILKSYLDIKVSNVYCTKIASKLVRTYTDKHSLKSVVSELIGAEMDKTSQSTDWASSELSKAQLEYAASDVLYLIELKDKLDHMLSRENRVHLASECFKFLPTLIELDLNGWDEHIFSHH
jgi:ribonuclease D